MTSPMPEILATTHEGDRVRLELRVPGELALFKEHFPEAPILPGVVQIDWAIRLARRHFAWNGAFTALEGLKFQEPIPPETRLTLELDFDAARGRLGFAYLSATGKHASGYIVFGGAP